jgi:hypothetical protein
LEEIASRGALYQKGGKLPEHGLKMRTSATTLVHHQRDEALRSGVLNGIHAPEVLGELNVLRFS